MNTEETESLMKLAACRISFNVPLETVANGLRALGVTDEEIFLLLAAAQILAK